MNEFESDWISLSQSQSEGRVFLSESERRKQGVWIPQCRSWIQDGRIQDGRIQDGCHHQVEWEWMSLSQIELVWVRVRVEGERFWVNVREENKVSDSNMAVSESKMAEFQMSSPHQVKSEGMNEVFCVNGGEGSVSEVFLCQLWEPILASVSKFGRKNEDGWFQDGQIQDNRIQDGCHHQVEWEWMSLNQIELVWVRVRVEGERFWVNVREEKQGVWFQHGRRWIQDGRIQNSKIQYGHHDQVKSEWMSEVFLVQILGTNLAKYECVWEEKLRLLIPRWPNSRWQNSRWLPSSS